MRLRLQLFLLLFTLASLSYAESTLDSIAITVRGRSREFAFTNKESAFLYGETNDRNTTSWQGFNVFGHEFLDDYDLVVDGHTLDRRTATVTVFPDFLRRTYAEGIVEEVHPVDSLALFAVHLLSPGKPVSVEFVPWLTDARSASDLVLVDSAGTALLARARHTTRTSADNYPVWLGMRSLRGALVRETDQQANQYSPLKLKDAPATRHVFVVSVSDSLPDARSMTAMYLQNAARLQERRRHRMEGLLASTRVETDDLRLNKALAWAKLSLDALIMNQTAKGIFAGLPWFNNYWGRDTFIALPGATLVTGRFREARAILRSFSAFQNTDTASTDYGRIPNLVTTTDKAYNTADGTPRFVAMAREYAERSGDTPFVREIYPVIVRAAEGTLRFHCDSLGFLVHGDAETWMDAVGPDGPWSPRGNRANDIQALWAAQLDASVWFARLNNDQAHAAAWQQVQARCTANFAKYFLHDPEGPVADHLNADGTQDHQLRPNQIFTTPLLDEATRAAVVRTVTTKLTYEYGVASLWQGDENFHPFHQYEPYYPKDAAYHNGTVWTWLQGPLISELCRFGRPRIAFRITRNTVHQILDRGAVGTQSELLDAIPHPGETEPRLSGTFSQAWNLGEFVRNFYDDYLGVRIDRLHHQLTLHPHLPTPMANVSAAVNVDGENVDVRVDLRPGNKTIVLSSADFHDSLSAIVELPASVGHSTRTMCMIPAGATITLAFRGDRVSAFRNNAPYPSSTWVIASTEPDSLLDPLTLAVPRIRPDLKALRGPDYPLLSNAAVKTDNPRAAALVDQADPTGDDTGTGQYMYPRNALFVPGSFDLTHFTVRTDSANAYFTLRFRALSNPGWHPEYGFQLTYVAIAIDEDGKPGSGNRHIPANANYLLPPEQAYEKLLVVGGGVRLEDANGKTLAAYIPVTGDEAHPLGNTGSATISFAIPLRYLGQPSQDWTFTVLAGAQDDHGGAGIGEFRTVNKEAGEWNGGGRTGSGDPNVFDTLIAKPAENLGTQKNN